MTTEDVGADAAPFAGWLTSREYAADYVRKDGRRGCAVKWILFLIGRGRLDPPPIQVGDRYLIKADAVDIGAAAVRGPRKPRARKVTTES